MKVAADAAERERERSEREELSRQEQVAAEAAAAAAASEGERRSAEKEASSSVATPYELTFHTGSKWGAGTDSSVCCQLVGAAASSPTLLMNKDKKLFEAKSVDTFTRNCPELGDLTQLRVWRQDAKGMMTSLTGGDKWYLDKVVVVHGVSGRSWEFEFDAWINNEEAKANAASAKVRRHVVVRAACAMRREPRDL